MIALLMTMQLLERFISIQITLILYLENTMIFQTYVNSLFTINIVVGSYTLSILLLGGFPFALTLAGRAFVRKFVTRLNVIALLLIVVGSQELPDLSEGHEDGLDTVAVPPAPAHLTLALTNGLTVLPDSTLARSRSWYTQLLLTFAVVIGRKLAEKLFICFITVRVLYTIPFTCAS